jgi:hypothetical protein
MKQTILCLIFCLTLVAGQSQSSINTKLKQELDSILVMDQLFRGYMSTRPDSVRVDSISKAFNIPGNNFSGGLVKMMNKTDSTNFIRMKAILEEFGYPGKTLVGEPTNEAGFYVIQHSNEIDRYLPLVEKAAKAGELPFYLYAMMKDRSLMNKNKPQIWGSQAQGISVVNKITGKTEMKFFIWPIEDPARVNERRKEAGFKQTVEENAKRMDIEYKVVTMEEVMSKT